MKKKKTWGQRFLTLLWWCTVLLPLFAGFRWIMATWFLLMHRLFRSSSGVRDKQEAAYDEFFATRRNVIIGRYGSNLYPLVLAVMSQQKSHYICLETLQAMQVLFVIDDQTVFDLMDIGEYCLIDRDGIELAYGLRFGVYHESTDRDDKMESMIRRSYPRDGEGVEAEPPAMTVGDLINVQMKANPVGSPKISAPADHIVWDLG